MFSYRRYLSTFVNKSIIPLFDIVELNIFIAIPFRKTKIKTFITADSFIPPIP